MASWFEKKKKEKKAARQRVENARSYVEEQYAAPGSCPEFKPEVEACGAPDRAVDPDAVNGQAGTAELRSRLTDEYYQNVLKDAYPPEDAAAPQTEMPTRSESVPEESPLAVTVNALIEVGKLDEKKVCKNAHIDRELMKRVREERGFRPEKDTVVALAVGLGLNKAGATRLLENAGYGIDRSSKRDLAIEYCFSEKVSTVKEMNSILEKLGEKPLARN